MTCQKRFTGGQNILVSYTELPPGTYTVSVKKAGFSEAVVADVTVVVNSTTRIDVPLAVGTATQTVEVIVAPALLQTDRPTWDQR